MMTINALIAQLRLAKPDQNVYYDFSYLVPTKVESWRGAYDEPALGWVATDYSGPGKSPTVAALIAELEKSVDGRTYNGWKGGEYRFDSDQGLHIDNRGESSHTEITYVEIGAYDVIIHTEKTE